MSVLYICMCTTCMSAGFHRTGVMDSWELHGSWNRTQVLYKRNECSQPQSHLSSLSLPLFPLYPTFRYLKVSTGIHQDLCCCWLTVGKFQVAETAVCSLGTESWQRGVAWQPGFFYLNSELLCFFDFLQRLWLPF